MKIRSTSCIIKHISNVSNCKTIEINFKYIGTNYFKNVRKNKDLDGFCLKNDGSKYLLEIPIPYFDLLCTKYTYMYPIYHGYYTTQQLMGFTVTDRYRELFTYDKISAVFYSIVKVANVRGIRLNFIIWCDKIIVHSRYDTEKFIFKILENIPDIVFRRLHIISQCVTDVLSFINNVKIVDLKFHIFMKHTYNNYFGLQNHVIFNKYVNLFKRVTNSISTFHPEDMYAILMFLCVMPYTTCSFKCRITHPKIVHWISLIARGVAQTECNLMTCQHLCDVETKGPNYSQLHLDSEFDIFPYCENLKKTDTAKSIDDITCDSIRWSYLCIKTHVHDRNINQIIKLKYKMISQIIRNAVLIPPTYETKHLSAVNSIINEALDKLPDIELHEIKDINMFNERHKTIKNILSDVFSVEKITKKLDNWCRYCASFHKKNESNSQQVQSANRYLDHSHFANCKMTFARFLITHHLYDPRLLLYITSFASVNLDREVTGFYDNMKAEEVNKEIKLFEFYYVASKIMSLKP